MLGILFLELNGYRFTATEAASAEAIMQLAAGFLHEAEYAEFLRRNTIQAPPS